MTSNDLELGPKPAPRKSLTNQSAWIESEIHEFPSSSSSSSPLSTSGLSSVKQKQPDAKTKSPLPRPKSRALKQSIVLDSDHESLISDSMSATSGDVQKAKRSVFYSKTDSSSSESHMEQMPKKSPQPPSKSILGPGEIQSSMEERDMFLRDIISLGSRRLSGGDFSHDDSHSVTSQSYSETRSYRDRIRDRFHSVKERVGHSVSGPKFRFQRDLATSRFDDLLRKEEAELKAALEKRDTDRHKRKDSNLVEVIDVNASYDFFTRVWDEETGDVAVQEGDVDADLHSNDSGQDSTKLLALDYLGLPQGEWDILDRFGPAMKWDKKKVASKQAEILYVPSTDTVPLEEKLPPGQVVRYPEEEGLFVGERPRERAANRNRFQRRLIAQGDTHWFGDDGELKTLRDPLQYPLLQPVVPKGIGDSTTLVQYVPPLMMDLSDREMDSETGRQVFLEFDIDSLHFKHHPLFSREHVIAGRLCELYNQYQQRNSLKKQERLAKRLESLRAAYDSCKAQVGSDPLDQTERLRKYSLEIRETRKQWLAESLVDRQLAASLLSTWRDLKRVRSSQNYTVTPHKLSIQCSRPKSAQKMREKAVWEEQARRTVAEVEEELKQDFTSQTQDYERQMKLWKEKADDRKAQKTADRRQHSTGDSIHSDADEQRIEAEEEQKQTPKREERESGNDVSPPSISEAEGEADSEPVPPAKLDLYEARRNIIETMRKCLRPPGEPRLAFTLTENIMVDESDAQALNNVAEKQRRIALKRCEISIRVFYNEKEVCRTDVKPIGERFVVLFKERFSIKLRQPPESIKLLLIEDGAGGGRHLLTELFIPIPSGSAAFDCSETERLDFSSPRCAQFKHAGVGSGPPGDPELGCLYTSGTLNYNVGWGRDPEDGTLLAPRAKYLPPEDSYIHCNDLVSAKGTRGALDVDKLADWASMAQLDPNDPANATLFYFIKNARRGRLHGANRYLLKSETEFDFCDDHFINDNLRFRLLKLRDQGEPEFKDMRFVPNREKEITSDIFKAYERRVSAALREVEYESDASLDDHFTSVRAWGRQYLSRVQQQVLARYRQARSHAELDHFISEEQVPDISTLGLTLVKWLRPKRPLRPERRERKKIAVGSLAGQEVRLVVSVVRAFQVPVRRDADFLAGPPGGVPGAPSSIGPLPTPASPTQALGFSTVPVRPFVEVSFQGMSTRTTAAEGANPTWNQDLVLPVRPGGEDNNIFIHLFDEVLEDLLEDDRLRETNIHQRITRHWLAGLTVPFTTLVHSSQMEGTFQLYSPPVLLGYERETHQRPNWNANGSHTATLGGPLMPSQQFQKRDATFLTVYITVQPALLPPDTFKERLESSEAASVEQHLWKWQQKVESSHPHRAVKPLVTDVSGKTVCVTRFIRPIMPPVLNNEESTTLEMAARFIAMIPVAAKNGMLDIWFTCDQVVRVGWGDANAHAVMLCCFLLGLGHSASLLLGTGVPYGPVAYVLLCDKKDYSIWDATTGQRFSVHDAFCPLQRVFALVNQDNIWLNIQREELPRRTRFDVTRRSDWSPALAGKAFPSVPDAPFPAGSVQPSALEFPRTAPSAVVALQERLEKRLRDALMKWRRTRRTLWNRYCIAMLRKLLPRLEQCTWNLKDQSSPQHAIELQHILGSHQMCGFPLNFPYTTTDAVLEAVRATGVHCNEDENVEFALAVHIHAFPCDIISVWVYVASLVKRK